MFTRQTTLFILLVLFSVLSVGCATRRTVPAWKGIPARILSPTSQEAMAWDPHSACGCPE